VFWRGVRTTRERAGSARSVRDTDTGRNEGDDEQDTVWGCGVAVGLSRVCNDGSRGTSTSRHSRGLSQVRLRLNNAELFREDVRVDRGQEETP
jgi:hypothetical protein